ncbi:hypothetical protein [Paenibacillus apiarius]|uniref:hypothetical protein n=1 Tax=Paenibacillus apiarius TaxID=46240 RepID=UPI003B3A4DF6
MSTVKKPIYKRWWFWLACLIVVAAIFGRGDGEQSAKQSAEKAESVPAVQSKPEEPKKDTLQEEVKQEEKSEEATTSDSKPETQSVTESSEEESIKSKVEAIAKELYGTSIKEIKVNENMGTDATDDYIVLAYLSFDVKNKAKTTKGVLELNNNELGAKLAEIENISELAIFWEVPYLKEGSNIAKANLQRTDKGMAFKDVWYDGNIFD